MPSWQILLRASDLRRRFFAGLRQADNRPGAPIDQPAKAFRRIMRSWPDDRIMTLEIGLKNIAMNSSHRSQLLQKSLNRFGASSV